MVYGIGRSFFAISAAALLAVGSLSAQGAKDTFKDALRHLYKNEDSQALTKLKEVLAESPDHEAAYELWKETDARVWRYLISKGGDFEKIADYILSKARIERKKRINDAEAIGDLITVVLTGDTGARQKANLTLASNHGEFAVPFLVDALGNADDEDAQLHAIMAIEAIGTVATPALLPLLSSDNKILRQNVALSLMHLGDNRSLPYLQRLAESDKDAGIRAIAKKAVGKIGGAKVSGSLDLFVQQANGFLKGDPLLVRDDDASSVLWSLVDGKLVAHAVPTLLFGLEQGKNAGYGALQVDPKSREGQIVLARTYIAEKSILDSAPEGAGLDEFKSSSSDLGITTLAAGTDVIREAVRRNVEANMVPAAVSGLGMLARLEDPDNLAGSPLLAALGSADSRLAYESALALAGMGAPLEQGTRDMIVKVLADAVQEQAIKNIQVISGNKNLSMALGRKTGFWVDASNNAKDGMIRVADNGADVVVIDENVQGTHPLQIIEWVRRKAPEAKIILMANSPEKAEEVYGEKTDVILKMAASGDDLVKAVDGALDGVDLGAGRRYATKIAEASAQTLASLDPALYNLAPASASLAKTAGREGTVGLFSLRALARGGDMKALPSIAKVLKDNMSDEAMAIAACDAMGRIMARNKKADQAVALALVDIAKNKEASAKVRTAAVAALGRSPLLADQRTMLLESLQVTPGSEAAAGEDDGSED